MYKMALAVIISSSTGFCGSTLSYQDAQNLQNSAVTPSAAIAAPTSTAGCVTSRYGGGYGCDNSAGVDVVSDPSEGAANDPTAAAYAAKAAAQALNINALSPDCLPAYQRAITECNSAAGKGSLLAAGVNGAATVINISNGQQNSGANGACQNAETSAIANNLGNGIIATSCYLAHSSCNVCSVVQASPYINDLPAKAACDNAFRNFEVQFAAQAAAGLAQVALAAKCGNQTAVTTPNIPGTTAYNGPQVDEPANAGTQKLAPDGQKTPQADSTSAGSGSLPGGAAYPGGAAGPAASAKNDSGGLTAPALGLSSGGGGGGWPTGAAGGGGTGGAAGAAPFDLSSLLPGHDKDPSRGPASVASEVTGANDLTNFQKVTRMMNKSDLF